MCDYSLERYASRPARVGETLRLERFPTGSPGFTEGLGVAGGASSVAVCLLPGARLRLEGIPAHVRDALHVGPTEEVEMVHARKDIRTSRLSRAYRDAVIFQNGTTARLVDLVYDSYHDCMVPLRISATVLMTAGATAPEDAVLAGPPPPVRERYYAEERIAYAGRSLFETMFGHR